MGILHASIADKAAQREPRINRENKFFAKGVRYEPSFAIVIRIYRVTSSSDRFELRQGWPNGAELGSTRETDLYRSAGRLQIGAKSDLISLLGPTDTYMGFSSSGRLDFMVELCFLIRWILPKIENYSSY